VLAGVAASLRLGGERITDDLGRGASLSGRTRLWAVTLTMIAARPLNGWGAGRFAATYPAFQRTYVHAVADPAVTDLTDHPHDDYLLLAAEAGVPTMLAFIAIVVLALWQATAARARADTAPAAGGLAALALLALVDTPFRLPATAALFCILLVAVLDLAAAGGCRPLARWERLVLAALAVLALFHMSRLLIVDRSLAASRRALAGGDTGAAQGIADGALRLDGSNADLWMVLAQARYVAGDDAGALAAATRTRALRPTPEIVYLLSAIERRQGRCERAIADLRDLSETLPGLLRPRVLLGEAYADAGRVDEARSVLTTVLAMRSKVPSPDEQRLRERAADVRRTLSSHDG
jgi:tetratricopeptide (TPR) repeat protein